MSGSEPSAKRASAKVDPSVEAPTHLGGKLAGAETAGGAIRRMARGMNDYNYIVCCGKHGVAVIRPSFCGGVVVRPGCLRGPGVCACVAILGCSAALYGFYISKLNDYEG